MHCAVQGLCLTRHMGCKATRHHAALVLPCLQKGHVHPECCCSILQHSRCQSHALVAELWGWSDKTTHNIQAASHAKSSAAGQTHHGLRSCQNAIPCTPGLTSSGKLPTRLLRSICSMTGLSADMGMPEAASHDITWKQYRSMQARCKMNLRHSLTGCG